MSQLTATRHSENDGLYALHRQLAAFNRSRLTPNMSSDDWQSIVSHEYAMRQVEGQFVQHELTAVRTTAAAAPRAPGAFLRWFEDLNASGPGQHDSLFPWLAQSATAEQMTWFVAQEMAGEAGFDDLVALTQVKMPPEAKLELGHNYWDELGRGHAGGMHGPMLERLGIELGISMTQEPVWQALALGNLMVALAANRHYAYQAIGALGVIEMTAPLRATFVNAGLKRLGVAPEARRYYALHATLDVKHSVGWNRHVIRPLLTQQPMAARALAEGALLRLRAGERCFDRYRAEFSLRHERDPSCRTA